MDVQICPQVFAECYTEVHFNTFYHYNTALHGILIATADGEAPLGHPPDPYDTHFRDKAVLLLWNYADSLVPDKVRGVYK